MEQQHKYYPALDQIKELAGKGNLTPIYREIMADLETPVSAFLKVCRDEPNSFLLESVEGGERLARYSFMGSNPYLVLKLENGTAYARINGYKQTLQFTDPLEVVHSYLKAYQLVEAPGLENELPRFYGGAVGYLGYEAVGYFEKLPRQESNPVGVPEGMYLFVDTMVVFDHLKRKIKLVAHVHLDGNIEKSYAEAVERIEKLAERLAGPVPMELVQGKVEGAVSGPVVSNFTREAYEEAVLKTKEYIRAGDIFQANVGQRFARPTNVKPINIYRTLRAVNPSPYMFYLHFQEFDIIGASPELLVQVEGRTVETHPIAGTRPRGKDAASDAKFAEELLADEKERAEHVMLVDLGRNDLGRVCTPGTVHVEDIMHIERYSHVMHMVTNVIGELAPGKSAFDALRSCFPMGTVTGAPKIRAMEIIAELEPEQRGAYGGAVGYFGFSGNMDTCLTIRTIVLKDQLAYVQAAAGLVADSVPANEYQETVNKVMGMLRALDEAEKME
ncbi:MAG TPA: anthranilate synthase component I [Chloroflexia bacterium]|nr:anthranilate synthase component I [Chloroflexia bacterium]